MLVLYVNQDLQKSFRFSSKTPNEKFLYTNYPRGISFLKIKSQIH